jgi:hypothetical protein
MTAEPPIAVGCSQGWAENIGAPLLCPRLRHSSDRRRRWQCCIAAVGRLSCRLGCAKPLACAHTTELIGVCGLHLLRRLLPRIRATSKLPRRGAVLQRSRTHTCVCSSEPQPQLWELRRAFAHQARASAQPLARCALLTACSRADIGCTPRELLGSSPKRCRCAVVAAAATREAQQTPVLAASRIPLPALPYGRPADRGGDLLTTR